MSEATKHKKLVIGTRGSQLALWQANYVKGLLEEITGKDVELKIIKTTGDKILDVPLAKVGGKGLFTKELEVALLAGEVDLCVHSMKDVPTDLPEGCVLAGMPQRVDSRDVLVAYEGHTLESLPAGGKVGTSSLRRIAQVRAARPDLEIVDVRGNLDTRMRKAEEGEVDVIILAAAGIKRLGWEDRISSYIPSEIMVSAVGQGAIGIEIREDDEYMLELCKRISDEETLITVEAERVIMNKLEGGCQVPIGAHAYFDGDEIVIDAMVGSVDGDIIKRTQVRGPIAESKELALKAVEELKEMGAVEILAEIREATAASDLV